MPNETPTTIAESAAAALDGPLLKPAHDAFVRGDFRASAALAADRLKTAASDEERRVLRDFLARYRPDPVVAGIVAGALLLFVASLTMLPR